MVALLIFVLVALLICYLVSLFLGQRAAIVAFIVLLLAALILFLGNSSLSLRGD